MTYFHELMRHFDMVFSSCLLVPIVLLSNIFRAHAHMNFQHIWIECGLDFLLGLSLLRFAAFMGMVEDISANYSHWTYLLIAVTLLSFSLITIHVLMLLKLD